MHGKKLSGMLILVVLCCGAAAAQDAPAAEVFGGYSYLRLRGNGEAGNLHGWNAAFAGNLTPRFAVVADFAGGYDEDAGVDVNLHTFLFGPQAVLRRERASVFARALFGAARVEASAFGVSAGETSFSMALGGGVDVPVGRRASLRVLQADYLLTRFGSANQHNVRLSAGLVLRLGSLR